MDVTIPEHTRKHDMRIRLETKEISCKKKDRQTQSMSYKSYGERLKCDTVRYEQHKLNDVIMKRYNRKNMNDERRQKYNAGVLGSDVLG